MAGKTGDVTDQLVQGLCRLEYRGYDSCGVALLNGNGIEVVKDVGGPSRLTGEKRFDGLHGTAGIGHTRWATHGGVSQSNAHPHVSANGRVAIVHNGVLNNFRELREGLRNRGFEIHSETDSELIAHLIQEQLDAGLAPREAILALARKMEGTYAIAILLEDDPRRIFALRQESPLVIGFGEAGVIVASDPLAISSICEELQYVEDGELVEVSAEGSTLLSLVSGEVIERDRRRIEDTTEDPELGDFSSFMAKEMSESAVAARGALAIDDRSIEQTTRAVLGAKRVFLTGMGTAFHMAVFGHHILGTVARRFCPVVTADEIPEIIFFEPGDVLLGISQSGETYDTLRALRRAKQSGATTIAIVNVPGSSMAREVDQVIHQGAGPEVAVLATKIALSQALVIARIAVSVAQEGGAISTERGADLEAELKRLPEMLEAWLPRIDAQSREVAARFLGLEKWFFLGRGLFSAVALEGALKFKEVTYRHAEGMAAGFLKHGTISLIDPEMGTAMFVPPRSSKALRELTMTALEEVHSRGGPLLAVGDFSAEEKLHVDATIDLPGETELTDAFLQILAGQYLAYHTARALGRDIDRPRALAKSVTVP
jgi:glucosamine--fructose-6-phosphate aminotransferase (isomerizing)